MFSDDILTPLRQELPGIVTGVGASRTMVAKVPAGATYTRLLFLNTIAGVAATRVQLEAMLGEVRVLLNGINIETLTAKQIIALAEFYTVGITGDTGYLVFDFQRLWMAGIAAQNGPAWGTQGESSFEIQIDQAAGSTIDLVTVYAEVEPRATELGAYIQRLRVSPAVAGIGHAFNANLPQIDGARLLALHIETSVPANLTAVRFACDDINLINLPVAVLNRFYVNATPGRTIQNAIRTGADGTTSGFVHLDFACRNYEADSVPMTYQKHLLDETFINAAPTVHNIIMEVLRVQPSRRRA